MVILEGTWFTSLLGEDEDCCVCLETFDKMQWLLLIWISCIGEEELVASTISSEELEDRVPGVVGEASVCEMAAKKINRIFYNNKIFNEIKKSTRKENRDVNP